MAENCFILFLSLFFFFFSGGGPPSPWLCLWSPRIVACTTLLCLAAALCCRPARLIGLTSELMCVLEPASADPALYPSACSVDAGEPENRIIHMCNAHCILRRCIIFMFKWFHLWVCHSFTLPQSAILFSFFHSVPCFSVYLSFLLPSFILLSLSHLLSAPPSVLLSLFISLFLPLCLCLCLLLPCPSFFPSVSFSPSPAVINRSPVGCWSVRNCRSDGFSQLLQAFPGSPHRTALCGPGFQTCRQNIQNMNRVLNGWTALMCAWFISLNRPTSEHISCNNKINHF